MTTMSYAERLLARRTRPDANGHIRHFQTRVAPYEWTAQLLCSKTLCCSGCMDCWLTRPVWRSIEYVLIKWGFACEVVQRRHTHEQRTANPAKSNMLDSSLPPLQLSRWMGLHLHKSRNLISVQMGSEPMRWRLCSV